MLMEQGHAIFVRWLRCELGFSWRAVAREAHAAGLLSGAHYHQYQGRELCRQSARFFDEDDRGTRWNSDGLEDLPWPKECLPELELLRETWPYGLPYD